MSDPGSSDDMTAPVVMTADARAGTSRSARPGANEGRTAHLSVVSAPHGRGIAKFKVTVWETPAA
ncbi:hypothetical protein [Streptomyces sp. SD31]|uniref:hypothetical protein n=1 Tax=Streptomyces sp. SD31 TaxID=3452208 RepID=UPI003F89F9DF